MSEPDYLAQTGEAMTSEHFKRWADARISDAKAQGMTHLRMSMRLDEGPGLYLLEGWRERPENEGDPRFQFEAS